MKTRTGGASFCSCVGLRLFDEFLRQEELDLALHTSSNFWLEPSSGSVDTTTIKVIEHLHQLMNIKDGSVRKLMANQDRKLTSQYHSTERLARREYGEQMHLFLCR
jgi:hypothetical protein